MNTRIRCNTAQRATRSASVSIEELPRACARTASELQTCAAASTVPVNGEIQALDPQINKPAIESFLQAAPAIPISAVHNAFDPQSDADRAAELGPTGYCCTPRVIQGAEAGDGEPDDAAAPGKPVGGDLREPDSATFVDRRSETAGTPASRFQTAKEPI